MHNYYNRINNVFFFGFTSLVVYSFIIALTTISHAADPKVDVRYKGLIGMIRSTVRPGTDYAKFTFDMDVDLRSEFQWNLRQLYVSVAARYIDSDDGFTHDVVVWDRIVEHEEDAKFSVRDEAVEYNLEGVNLKNRGVTLSVHWENLPITGNIWFGSGREGMGNSTFQLPRHYTR